MRYLLIALIILPLTACFEKQDSSHVNELKIISANGQSHEFKIEIARTDEEKIKGLMFRTKMPEDAGMLFVFDNEEERNFWMRNTLISLDMLFIKADGTIHHIHKNAIPEDLTRISSNGPVQAVLELNGGISDKLNIQAGDKINHAIFGGRR